MLNFYSICMRITIEKKEKSNLCLVVLACQVHCQPLCCGLKKRDDIYILFTFYIIVVICYKQIFILKQCII